MLYSDLSLNYIQQVNTSTGSVRFQVPRPLSYTNYPQWCCARLSTSNNNNIYTFAHKTFHHNPKHCEKYEGGHNVPASLPPAKIMFHLLTLDRHRFGLRYKIWHDACSEAKKSYQC